MGKTHAENETVNVFFIHAEFFDAFSVNLIPGRFLNFSPPYPCLPISSRYPQCIDYDLAHLFRTAKQAGTFQTTERMRT